MALDDEKITQQVEAIAGSLHHAPAKGEQQPLRIQVLFYAEKSLPWESWTIQFNSYHSSSPQSLQNLYKMAEKQLRACLFYIASIGSSEHGHIPHGDDPSFRYSVKVSCVFFVYSPNPV